MYFANNNRTAEKCPRVLGAGKLQSIWWSVGASREKGVIRGIAFQMNHGNDRFKQAMCFLLAKLYVQCLADCSVGKVGVPEHTPPHGPGPSPCRHLPPPVSSANWTTALAAPCPDSPAHLCLCSFGEEDGRQTRSGGADQEGAAGDDGAG